MSGPPRRWDRSRARTVAPDAEANDIHSAHSQDGESERVTLATPILGPVANQHEDPVVAGSGRPASAETAATEASVAGAAGAAVAGAAEDGVLDPDQHCSGGLSAYTQHLAATSEAATAAATSPAAVASTAATAWNAAARVDGVASASRSSVTTLGGAEPADAGIAPADGADPTEMGSNIADGADMGLEDTPGGGRVLAPSQVADSPPVADVADMADSEYACYEQFKKEWKRRIEDEGRDPRLVSIKCSSLPTERSERRAPSQAAAAQAGASWLGPSEQ